MNSASYFEELLSKGAAEPLCDELKARIMEHGDDTPVTMIHHPLLVTHYTENLNALYNAQLEERTRVLRRKTAERDFAGAVFVYERGYRIDAFWRFAQEDGLLDANDFNNLLREVWTDTEFPHQSLARWHVLWRDKRFDPELAMTGEERAKIKSLPAYITIYRGASKRKEALTGLSWTLSKTKAEWFAKRWLSGGRPGAVVERRVFSANVKAYFAERGEDEIIMISDIGVSPRGIG
jgi:hypothetical protein